MTYFRKLAGDLCYLSPVAAEDAAHWARWFNDPVVTVPLGDEAYAPLSLEKASADVRAAIERQDQVFTIVDAAREQPIGRALLFGVDHANRSAMLGIAIGERSYWGKGYGLEATVLLLDYAFNLLNLHSVWLGCFAFNERALAVYRRAGFHEIGRRRAARLVAGQAHDVVLMDMLEDEFRAAHASRVRVGQGMSS